jgi:hypothetical protein
MERVLPWHFNWTYYGLRIEVDHLLAGQSSSRLCKNSEGSLLIQFEVEAV